MTFDPASLDSINGLILPEELSLLYRLAEDAGSSNVLALVVEIGAFQGKSTVALTLGILNRNPRAIRNTPQTVMVSIDAREGMRNPPNGAFSLKDQAIFFQNLLAFNVADIVRVVSYPSHRIARSFPYGLIDLLFIDGGHDYATVYDDFRFWNEQMQPHGKIAFHDATNPDFPDVGQVVADVVKTGKWRESERVGTIIVLERVGFKVVELSK